MEYKKDKRTKNLTLREIHVGDWVQVWSDITERYSPPLKIISIHDDGIIYLITNYGNRSTPWEENIKNIDALEITVKLLEGFGFEEIISGRFYYKECPFKYSISTGNLYIGNVASPIKYFHDLQDDLAKYLPNEQLKFEWKGV